MHERGKQRSLARILQVRALVEEQSRQQAEAAAGELRRMEDKLADARQAALLSRGRWFAALTAAKLPPPTEESASSNGRGEEEGEQGRWAEESCWQEANWRRMAAESSCTGLEEARDGAQKTLLGHRRERMEVEALLAAALEQARTRAKRVEQAGLDAWFLARPRKSVRPGASGEGPSREVGRVTGGGARRETGRDRRPSEARSEEKRRAGVLPSNRQASDK